MLEVVDIEKRFGDVVALAGVSLDVRPGQIVGFLGPNGAGKTTTMRAVMGLINLDGGAVRWRGTPVDSGRRRRFGYMPAERGMYPKMLVRDQIVYFARLAGLAPTSARTAADEWIERLGLTGRAGDEVQALSSGNQQRVQLAISLVHRPELLILDEPFSGLDPVAVETMKAVLSDQVAAGAAVLFSSHQLDLVSDLTTEVVIVDRGRVVLEGDVRALRERSPIRYATVSFAEAVTWQPALAGSEWLRGDERRAVVRVPASVEPGAVLADAATAGRVVAFEFVPPDLSEVFIDSIGGAG